MHGLSVGNDVLKQLRAEVSLEKVDRLMDLTREGVEYQRVRCLSPSSPTASYPGILFRLVIEPGGIMTCDSDVGIGN